MPLLSASAVAYPFIKVDIIPPPAPSTSRSPGVIAVVGKTPAGATGGSAPVNAPREVNSPADAVDLFASRTAGGAAIDAALSASLALAFQQGPRPSKIYGVRVDGDNYADTLTSLEAVDDVTFVGLAHEYNIDALMALKKSCRKHLRRRQQAHRRGDGRSYPRAQPDLGSRYGCIADRRRQGAQE